VDSKRAWYKQPPFADQRRRNLTAG